MNTHLKLGGGALIAALALPAFGMFPYTPEERSDWSNFQSYPTDNVFQHPGYHPAPARVMVYPEPAAWYYDSTTGYYYSRPFPGAVPSPSSAPRGYYEAPRGYYEAPRAYPSASMGVVDRIELVRRGDGSNIAGTVIGGIVGGVIGHQIGSGSGNTAATIAGAAGGAVVGHELSRRARADEAFRVTVRLDNGAYHTVMLGSVVDLRTGDRVRLEGNTLVRG